MSFLIATIEALPIPTCRNLKAKVRSRLAVSARRRVSARHFRYTSLLTNWTKLDLIRLGAKRGLFYINFRRLNVRFNFLKVVPMSPSLDFKMTQKQHHRNGLTCSAIDKCSLKPVKLCSETETFGGRLLL